MRFNSYHNPCNICEHRTNTMPSYDDSPYNVCDDGTHAETTLMIRIMFAMTERMQKQR